MPARSVALVLTLFALAGCAGDSSAPIAEIRADVAALKDENRALRGQLAKAAPKPVELGQQMLELQVRHARLWLAIEQRQWDFAQFQVAELKEALDGVVEENPEDPALQPERLADVLPSFMKPAVDGMMQSFDTQDQKKIEQAYDALSAGCTGCHATAGFTFLVVQRPGARLLDNVGAAPKPQLSP